MQLSKGLRTRLGLYRFKKEAKKIHREREITNFDDAVKIGLVYDATDEHDTETMKNYVKNLRSNMKKDVLALGYIDKKTPHPSQYAQFGLDFFTRKDLNFNMIPADPIVNNFINEKFDILINVYASKALPLRYVSAHSQAKFKIGCFNSGNADYMDMMVKMESGTSLKNMINEIEHFLRIIHSHESKQT
jgi:hypothetical protein